MNFLSRRAVLQVGLASLAAALPVAATAETPKPDWSLKLVEAARSQIGVTLLYDPAYVGIAYPGGDVPAERGVCSDVVIRAYRTAFGLDLQKLVHEDKRANFAAYPKTWGMRRADTNIDHRRVLNLAAYFRRRGAALSVSEDLVDYRPGDLVTQILPGKLPHIAVVSLAMSDEVQGRPLMIHNIGEGVREEDTLSAFERTGHFRFAPR
ncbi:hypothetical protein LMIY3S_05793 [Labrys miyagiensis]